MQQPKNYHDLIKCLGSASYLMGYNCASITITFYFDNKETGTRKGFVLDTAKTYMQAFACYGFDPVKNRYSDHQALDDIELENQRGKKAFVAKLHSMCQDKYLVSCPRCFAFQPCS